MQSFYFANVFSGFGNLKFRVPHSAFHVLSIESIINRIMPRLVLEFSKMHGAGNDFIVIDNRFYCFPEAKLSELAQTFCDRRLGIGGDGLLALNGVDEDETHFHFQMRYFNADGSLGSMCGNGARVLAQFAYRAGIRHSPLVFETSAGEYRAIVAENPETPVKLFMPSFEDYRPNMLQGTTVGDVHYIFTGTQHGVVFVENVATLDVPNVGKELRWHEVFQPKGINMNFAQIVSEGNENTAAEIEMRTFEKGVEAETLACGTGALAVALVAYLQGKVHATHINLQMKGGLLQVGFSLENESITDIYQAGPTTTVFRGSLEL